MQRRLIITDDGSSSIHLPEWNESYHSKHGAVQEAYHVFLEMGLFHFLEKHPLKKPVRILEIGFGTGLNAFITFLEAEKNNFQIEYTGVEAYPVNSEEVKHLNYAQRLSVGKQAVFFEKLHQIPWEEFHEITPHFRLKKEQNRFETIAEHDEFELIYFDAFGARVQPELWTKEIFEKMYKALRKNGMLVTYSAKGSAKRAMKEIGFEVEILQGPPGKRHMLRATKP